MAAAMMLAVMRELAGAPRPGLLAEIVALLAMALCSPAATETVMSCSPAYRRVILKLSGEALMGQQSFGLDEEVLGSIADEIGEVVGLGTRAGGRACRTRAAWPARDPLSRDPSSRARDPAARRRRRPRSPSVRERRRRARAAWSVGRGPMRTIRAWEASGSPRARRRCVERARDRTTTAALVVGGRHLLASFGLDDLERERATCSRTE